MLQVPLMQLSEILRKKLNRDDWGNYIFWITFCVVGQVSSKHVWDSTRGSTVEATQGDGTARATLWTTQVGRHSWGDTGGATQVGQHTGPHSGGVTVDDIGGATQSGRPNGGNGGVTLWTTLVGRHTGDHSDGATQ